LLRATSSVCHAAHGMHPAIRSGMAQRGGTNSHRGSYPAYLTVVAALGPVDTLTSGHAATRLSSLEVTSIKDAIPNTSCWSRRSYPWSLRTEELLAKRRISTRSVRASREQEVVLCLSQLTTILALLPLLPSSHIAP